VRLQVVISNLHQHIYADFTPGNDPAGYPHAYAPVVGWSDDGYALVADPKKGMATRAVEYPNFEQLTWAELAINSAFPAPPGYTVADLDGTPLPVVGFAVVTGDRGIHSLFVSKGGEVLIETTDIVITPPGHG
jgi:hypothetical protein